MSETSKYLGRTEIVKDLADLATKLAGGTFTDGITILFNGVSVTAWSGNGAPTSSQLAHNVNDIYYDETNDAFYLCKSAVVTNGAVVTAWKRVATENDLTDVLRYSTQTLTTEQKTQARANIDAIKLEEYNPSATSYTDGVLYYTVD